MDPALQELKRGNPNAELEAVIRLHDAAAVPPQVRLVARFGRVATCRLLRRDIDAVWHSPLVASLKASRLMAREPEVKEAAELPHPAESSTEPRPARFTHPTITGRGVLIGIADWGFDFTHPNFLNPDGTTRFLAIWDQAAPAIAPSRYGYGRVYSADDINAALRTETPFQTLGYHPGKADVRGEGMHATHVLDIAGGGGQVGLPGLAPGTQFVAVQLAADGQSEYTTLGDSVHLLEALDFIGTVAHGGLLAWQNTALKEQVRQALAAPLPVVVNLSLGRHGGPHDGLTLVEQALDAWLEARPGRAVVQSSGNYYQAQTHAAGRVEPGQRKTLDWLIDPADTTPNELEIWYSGHDRLGVEVTLPGHPAPLVVALGQHRDIRHGGRLVGRVYHRANDPNNGDHHLDIFLYRPAPPGTWLVTLVGDDVTDGRFHAWIERDAGCYGCQSRFGPADVDPRTTTGTICNGFRTLAVGAYDARSPTAAVGSFSSSGPTANGRQKPDLAAPGVGIVAAKSTPAHARRAGPAGLLTSKSGTSMAAPHVTGTIALLFEAAGRLLPIGTTRRLLLASTDPAPGPAPPPPDPLRYGQGLLNPDRAVAAALALAAAAASSSTSLFVPFSAMETYFTEAVQSAGTLTQHGQAVPLQYDEGGVLRQAATLDALLRQALASPSGVYLVLGDLAGSVPFRLVRLDAAAATPPMSPPMSPPGPVIDYAAPAQAVALVATQPGDGRVFVPANVLAPGRRWVEVAGLRDFYALAPADQASQKNLWVNRLHRIRRQIAVPGVPITHAWLGRLGVPVLRVLLAQFAEHALPVRHVNEPARQFLGASAGGLTQPLIGLPLREPACYLRVIAAAEGLLETINAYDLGAGISVGPIQFNAQQSELQRLLGNLQRQDPDLFQQEFGTPLGWSVRRVGARTDIIIQAGQPTEVALVGDAAHAPQNVGYLESGRLGASDFSQVNAAFRQQLASRFRNVLAWPHVQELVLDTAAWWLSPGLTQIHDPANGIAALDPANPDADAFVLKALLLSAYVRYSACLGPLLAHLRPFATVADKLANLRAVLASGATDWGHCRLPLRQRLARRLFEDRAGHVSQHTAAQATFAVLQRRAAATTTEAWDGEAYEEEFEDWRKELDFENFDSPESAPEAAACGCGSHAAPTGAAQPEADWASDWESDWEADSCAEGCGCGSACGATEDTFYEDYLSPTTAFVLGALAAGPLFAPRPAAKKDDDESRQEMEEEPGDEGELESEPDRQHLVELAEVSLDADPRSVAALLQRVVFSQPTPPWPLGPAAAPAGIFDAFLPQGPAGARQRLSRYLAVVALPREVLAQTLQPGDIVLHRAYGEGQTYAAVVVSGELIPYLALGAGRYQAYAPRPGHYVQVVEAGPFPKRQAQAFVRRLTDDQHRLAHDQLVLRPIRPAPAPAEAAAELAERAPRPRFQCCNYAPSAGRQAFQAALAAGDWAEAYRQLNGLRLYEMLCALGSLARPDLNALQSQRAAAPGSSLPRLDYAATVVLTGLLPATAPGDLENTGQVEEAAEFLAERLMPEAEKVNPAALPHLALILKECRFYGVSDKSYVAYVLASAHHESGMGKFMSELAPKGVNAVDHFNTKYGSRLDLGNTQPGDGARFRGRGYVQITGRTNYTRYSEILSVTRFAVDLVANPEQVAQPQLAAPVLVHGHVNGIFTTRKLADFGADGSFDFVKARAIVNGRDKAQAIAAIARRYRELLDYQRCG